MSVSINKGRLGHGLEMTPMIDVVFLLMIFFLVASKLDEDDRSIEVVLPQAAAAKPLTSRPREFVINIDRDGNIFAVRHAGIARRPGRPVAAVRLRQSAGTERDRSCR